MMATVPHVTSGSGLRKFQTEEFLLDRVYVLIFLSNPPPSSITGRKDVADFAIQNSRMKAVRITQTRITSFDYLLCTQSYL